jgi:hypothetical protein
MIQARFFEKLTILGLIVISMMFISGDAQAQTRSRPRLDTNDPANYRYAYQHGYKNGYEDGFTKGKTDFNGDIPRDFASSDDYQNADRGYSARLGTLIEFKEGYRIGFELGYGDGYFGRPFTINIPTNLNKAVVTAINAANSGDLASNNDPPRTNDNSTLENQSRRRPVRSDFAVPDGIQMKLRLTTQINTKTNREGDRFTAVVLDPTDYADAIVEGHIAKLNKSGRATGKTELSLAFDSIRTRDGRTGLIAGQVERVYESESVKTVDEEGNVQTGSRTKDTATRTVGGGVLGAILGGVVGGGKGAAIGAAIGAGVGAGSVMIGDGKDLILDPGSELLIRTAAPER